METDVRGQACWYTPVIPALGRLGQEDLEFEASVCYIAKPYFRKQTQGWEMAQQLRGHAALADDIVLFPASGSGGRAHICF